MYIYIYACMYMCIYIYIYIQRRRTLQECFAVTLHRGVGEVPGKMEMIRASLPQLRKPSRTPEYYQKTVLL